MLIASFPRPDMWLLDNVWPAATALVCAFAILRMLGSQFGKKRMVQASWACLAALAVLLAAGQLIETTNKKLERQTRELAAACVGPDLEKFNLLADAEVKVTLKDAGHVAIQGPQVRRSLQAADIRSVNCSDFEVSRVQDGTLVKVSFSAGGDSRLWHGWGKTSWEVYWKETPDGWRVVEMRLVNMPGGPGMVDSLQIPH